MHKFTINGKSKATAASIITADGDAVTASAGAAATAVEVDIVVIVGAFQKYATNEIIECIFSNFPLH